MQTDEQYSPEMQKNITSKYKQKRHTLCHGELTV